MSDYRISDWDFKRWTSPSGSDTDQFRVGDTIRVKQLSLTDGKKEVREGVVTCLADETCFGAACQRINIDWGSGGSSSMPSDLLVKLGSDNYFADMTVTSIDFVEELINETGIAATRDSLLAASSSVVGTSTQK